MASEIPVHLKIKVGEIFLNIFSIAFDSWPIHWKLERLNHKHHELHYITSGQGCFEIRGRGYRVKAKDFFICPRGVIHRSSNIGKRNYEKLVIHFDFSFCHSPEKYVSDIRNTSKLQPFYRFFILGNNYLMSFNKDKMKEINKYINPTIEIVKKAELDKLDEIKKHLLKLLFFLNDMAKNSISYRPIRLNADLTQRIINLENAKRYIENNFDKNIPFKKIGESINLSQFHFQRVFKKTFGITPHQLQMMLRIEKAKALILDTNIRISDIARQVGYKNPEHFSQVFLHKEGMSPTKWAENESKKIRREE